MDSLRTRRVPSIGDTDARMLTPVAWKGTDGTLHKMRQAEIRFQKGAAQSEDDAARGIGTSSKLELPGIDWRFDKEFLWTSTAWTAPRGIVGTLKKTAEPSRSKIER